MYYLYRGKRAKNKVEFTEVSFLLSSKNLEDLIHFINEDDNRKGLPEITEHSFVNGIYEFTNRNDRDIIESLTIKKILENNLLHFRMCILN